jgi:hypothetical protein
MKVISIWKNHATVLDDFINGLVQVLLKEY